MQGGYRDSERSTSARSQPNEVSGPFADQYSAITWIQCFSSHNLPSVPAQLRALETKLDQDDQRQL